MARGQHRARQRDVEAGFDVSQLRFEPGENDRFVYSQCFVPLSPGKGSLVEEDAQAAAQAAGRRGRGQASGGLVQIGSPLGEALRAIGSQIGVLFLDRTRIRPKRAVLGEELLSLSLAPGEQVTIEQKTFSQRETTFEEQSEESQETDIELESTLTTGMEQALGKQLSEGSTTSESVSASIKPPPIEGVQVSIDPSFSHSVNSANSSSATTSVKRTSQTTRKIASKYRSVHKTTLRVSTQQQFTSSTQRTLRNPNSFTPIDLRYYKIYQELELCHERYGVRLAWAPAVLRPGADVLARANAAYQAVIEEALVAVTLPAAPTPPAAEKEKTVASDAQTVSNTGIWSSTWGVSEQITVRIEPPSGEAWSWDADTGFISSHLIVNVVQHPKDEPNIGVTGAWVDSSGVVTVTIHVGWSGGGEVSIQAQARFVQSNSAEQLAYQQQYAAYQAQKTTLMAQAKSAALPEAREARKRVLESCDPLAETLRQAISSDIPTGLRSSLEDLELWRSLFDWDGAGLALFAGWWGDALPDPESSSDAFVNALAARLYLPIRPGLERVATELVAQAVAGEGGAQLSASDVEGLIEEVDRLRERELGGVQELELGEPDREGCAPLKDKYVCLGTWTEVLPTEGTHLEVVQASTAATDELNSARVADDAAMRHAQTALVQSERSLQAAVKQGVAGAPVSVSVGVGSMDHFRGGGSEPTEAGEAGKPTAS